jgi:hypothetical protein
LVLWFRIGLIVLRRDLAGDLGGRAVHHADPGADQEGIWVIVLLLALIALIGVFVGGSSHPFDGDSLR